MIEAAAVAGFRVGDDRAVQNVTNVPLPATFPRV